MQTQKKITLLSEVLLHLIFWGMLVFIFNSSYAVKYASIKMIAGKQQVVVITKNILPHILLMISLKAVFFYFAVFNLLPKAVAYRKKETAFFFVISILILVVMAENLLLRFLSTFTYFELQEMKNLLPVNFILNIACYAATIAYFFINRWRKAEKRIETITQEQLLTELNMIKAQVTPHFLFNTLNNFFSMAQQQGNEKLAEKISALSGFMRYVLETTKTEKIPLQTEVDFIENYIEVMKMNYTTSEANVQFSKQDSLQNVSVIPMLLIPFVENAFKYGIMPGTASSIQLSLMVKEGTLTFSGSNPDYSASVKNSSNSFGIGLETVAKKIELYYASRGSIEYGSQDGIFRFTLKLPLQ